MDTEREEALVLSVLNKAQGWLSTSQIVKGGAGMRYSRLALVLSRLLLSGLVERNRRQYRLRGAIGKMIGEAE